MNTGTITTAATLLAVAAAAFAGCAAEESTTPPSANTTSPIGGTPTNTVGGMGPSNATNVTSGAGATNTNTTAASTTTTSGGVTATTAPGVTATTAPGATATTAPGVTSAGATSATTGGGSGCTAPAATGAEPIIDDFEDNDHTILTNEGRVGYWYQYGDPEGTQTTAPVDGVEGAGGVLTSTGSGFTEYGAGVGVDLNNNNSTGKPCEYDASFYTGIEFTLTTNAALSFKVALEATEGDSGHYEFPIAATDSGVIRVPFTMLAQPTWADAAEWDPAKILQLQWQAAAEVDFTITLDDVSFY